MARTPDPNRLLTEEATAFREFARDMRSRLNVENFEIADVVGASEDAITSTFRDSRGPGNPNPIMAAKALAVLEGFRRLAKRRDERTQREITLLLGRYVDPMMERPQWIYRYYARARQPAAFIIPRDVDRFGEVLADEAVRLGLPKSRRALIERAVVGLLRRESANMIRAWHVEASARVERFVSQASPHNAEYVTVPTQPRRKRWKGEFGDPFLQKDRSLLAVEVLTLTMDLFKPTSKKGRKLK